MVFENSSKRNILLSILIATLVVIAVIVIVYINMKYNSNRKIKPVSSNTRPQFTCQANERNTVCYNRCNESRCPTAPPISFCSVRCRPGCRCSSGYVRNARGFCVLPPQCLEVVSTTPKPLTCRPTEFLAWCYNPCRERCPGLRTSPCFPPPCRPGCSCRTGYLRNSQGICVPIFQCPKRH